MTNPIAAGLRIDALGSRGEGIARQGNRPLHIPFTVPGDIIDAAVHEERADMHALVRPSPDRVEPFCPYFTRCGGCATQSVVLAKQLEWKRNLVVAALARAGLDPPVDACIDAHGAGRRRATFHARRDADSRMLVGFMAARSHDLVTIDACPLFAPEMANALPAARVVATVLASTGKPLDIAVTATRNGLDIDVRGTGPLDDATQKALIAAAGRQNLVRLSNHGRPIVSFHAPTVRVGDIDVDLPPAGFLQATEAGELALASLVMEATHGAKRTADLYCGIGTFALRLGARAEVSAFESDSAAMGALLAAARLSSQAHTVRGDVRDLVRRPLSHDELSEFDAVIFDPPRAGAAEQVAELARSQVPLVVGISCNPQTFARDAKLLTDGGYMLERVTPVDQFRHSAHVELVGVFRRAKQRKKRSLLG